MPDFTTPLGRRAEQHLKEDIVVWLTTVDADGTPQPAPVWFWWDGETLLIYSQPKAKRLQNIARNPKVSLHFATDPEALEVVVLTGEAHPDPSAPRSIDVEPYITKYAKGVADLGWTPESFTADFSVPFRVKPTKLRGFLE